MTARAMGGSVRFEDALAARLDVMRPSAKTLAAFLAAHPPRLSPGVPALVRALQARGTGVFLVSGGFRAVIHPIAESLGIPLEHVYANRILFDVSDFRAKRGPPSRREQPPRPSSTLPPTKNTPPPPHTHPNTPQSRTRESTPASTATSSPRAPAASPPPSATSAPPRARRAS